MPHDGDTPPAVPSKKGSKKVSAKKKATDVAPPAVPSKKGSKKVSAKKKATDVAPPAVPRKGSTKGGGAVKGVKAKTAVLTAGAADAAPAVPKKGSKKKVQAKTAVLTAGAADAAPGAPKKGSKKKAGLKEATSGDAADGPPAVPSKKVSKVARASVNMKIAAAAEDAKKKARAAGAKKAEAAIEKTDAGSPPAAPSNGSRRASGGAAAVAPPRATATPETLEVDNSDLYSTAEGDGATAQAAAFRYDVDNSDLYSTAEGDGATAQAAAGADLEAVTAVTAVHKTAENETAATAAEKAEKTQVVAAADEAEAATVHVAEEKVRLAAAPGVAVVTRPAEEGAAAVAQSAAAADAKEAATHRRPVSTKKADKPAAAEVFDRFSDGFAAAEDVPPPTPPTTGTPAEEAFDGFAGVENAKDGAYECEFDCGFTGAEDAVAQHEATCAKNASVSREKEAPADSGKPAEEAFDGFADAEDANASPNPESAVDGVPFSGPPRMFVALYAYTSADVDDVSFVKGDTFTDVKVDEEEPTWATGTVVRTGASGNLPTSYVKYQEVAAAAQGPESKKTKKKKKMKKVAPPEDSADSMKVIDVQPGFTNATVFPVQGDPSAPGPGEDLSNVDVKEKELVKETGETVKLRGIGAELNEEELKEKAEWEAEKEALFREAQAKQAAIKAQKEADAAAKKVIDDGEAAKLAKQRAKLALRKAAEAAAEGGVLESLRDPDRVPVAQTDEQAAEYSAKEAGMKATIEEINSRTDGFDDANFAYWTDEKSDFDTDDQTTQRQKAEATSLWLSDALQCTYFGHSPFHEDDRSESEVALHNKVKKLLASRFAKELENMQQFEALKERLGVRCKELGTFLEVAHTEQLLKFKLSNKRVERFWKLHELAASPTQKDKDGKPTLTNCDIIPGLNSGLGMWDYKRPEQMGEMVAMQVVMLSARAANDQFQDAIKETIQPFTDITTSREFQAAPPKTFARPYNKGISEDDYRYESMPRGAGNCKDSVRNLICVKTGADLLGLIKALSDRFGGLGKLKNPYGYDDKRKESQCHLLLMNITIVFTDSKTYGKTFSTGSQTKKTKKMLEEYKGKLQMLPRDRWDASIDTALKFMTETSLASEPVRVLAEVQVLFSYDMIVREAMHDLYDVQRAVTAEQLAADKAKSKDLEAEVDNAGNGAISLRNCCIPEPSGGTATVLRLIEQNADVHEVIEGKGMFTNSQGGATARTYVYMAAENNHPDVLQIFIDHGVDIEAECGEGQQTALAAASLNGHTDCVKVLLNSNADVHHTDLYGETPIFRAAESCKVDTVQALLDAGANCNDEGQKRSNPLFYAAQGRSKNDPGGAVVIKLLIENGASPKYAMEGRRTPLHDAVKYGCPKAVKVLLENGALIEAVEDKTLMTPLVEGADLAETPQHIECIMILAQNIPPANVLHMSRLGTPKRIAEDNLIKKGEKSGVDSKAYEFQQRVVNVMKDVVASSVKIVNQNAVAIVAVETEYEELYDYITSTGLEFPEVAHAAMKEVGLGTFKLCEKNFKATGTNDFYLLESVLSDYTHDETAKLISALVDKKAFKEWRHDRQSKKDRKDIKKQRRRNSKAMEENEKVEVKLRRMSSAEGFSLDALVNINQECKEHRQKYEHTGEKGDLVALPGTPNLPEEPAIRKMLRDGAGGCCCACLVGEGAYVAADEGAFEQINVAVEWTYTLTTRYALRYLKQYLVDGTNSHPRQYSSHDGPEEIDFHQLKKVYDFQDSEVCGACVGSYEGKLLPGSAFKKTCVRCTGSGKITCDKCNGGGKTTCYSCSGRGKDSDGARCWSCDGRGSVTCSKCDGRGKVTCPDCSGAGYFAGWLAVCNYDGASISPYALASGVGYGDDLATARVKQKGSSKLVKDSKTTKSYDVDDVNGPAHPSASPSSRIQPLKCTAAQINQHSIDFIVTDNATNFYDENRGVLTTRDLDKSNQTFRYLSGGFTTYNGRPGFRLRGQNQKIEWEACAEMASTNTTHGITIISPSVYARSRPVVASFPRQVC